MLNLAEYRQKADRLSDHLPWAALVAPGVVLNKDGSFQRSFRFRGPDLESATEAELVAACARVNNVLRRLGSGWALFFEAERFAAPEYPLSEFADGASWLVDEERRAQFAEGVALDGSKTANAEHYENAYYLTLLYLAPPDRVASTERALIESGDDNKARDWRHELGGFVAETNRTYDLLGQVMAEIAPLDDGETLTYLHSTISPKRHVVNAPAEPMYLDGILADTPLHGGLDPMLGNVHLRALTILGFPNCTRPGLLDALNHLGFPYRWTTRFIGLDKTDSTKALTKIRRQWFNKRKSISQLLREVMHNEPVQLLDSDADNKVVDADAALQALGGDHVAFGYLTTAVCVTDPDRQRVEEKVRAIERVINGLGFTCIRESLNAVEAWLGSLPGHVYANVRQPLLHTLNLAHLMPLSSVWAAQWAVFDAQNYAQNVLEAARALQQINNQIQQLQNEAMMLRNMGTNLTSLNTSQLSTMVSALTQISTLMNQAQGIAFNVNATNAAFAQTYPQSYPTGTATPTLEADAQKRWQDSMAAFQQTLTVQAQVAQNVQADTATLTALTTASQGAVGNLQVTQATNQLLALSIKQQLQIQSLMAAQYRATSLDQARNAESEEEGRAQFQTFLGSGTAYTPQ